MKLSSFEVRQLIRIRREHILRDNLTSFRDVSYHSCFQMPWCFSSKASSVWVLSHWDCSRRNPWNLISFKCCFVQSWLFGDQNWHLSCRRRCAYRMSNPTVSFPQSSWDCYLQVCGWVVCCSIFSSPKQDDMKIRDLEVLKRASWISKEFNLKETHEHPSSRSPEILMSQSHSMFLTGTTNSKANACSDSSAQDDAAEESHGLEYKKGRLHHRYQLRCTMCPITKLSEKVPRWWLLHDQNDENKDGETRGIYHRKVFWSAQNWRGEDGWPVKGQAKDRSEKGSRCNRMVIRFLFGW